MFNLPNCTLSKHFKVKKEEMNLRVKRAVRIQIGILLTILFLKRNIVVSFLSVVWIHEPASCVRQLHSSNPEVPKSEHLRVHCGQKHVS